LTDASAAALELIHCASLVHDDLPCFDNASVRRGKPSVHRVFGEPVAVLTGDALIVLAFEVLGHAAAAAPARLPQLIIALSQAAGSPNGIAAGQAWESEPGVPLDTYHQTKTGSLFTAATMMGAMAAGHDPSAWRTMGEKLGAAYQVADDLLDAVSSAGEAGKPTQRDSALHRPNAVARLGSQAALSRLNRLVGEAVESVPRCAGRQPLQNLILTIADRLVPESLRAA
jgi:geranylgeranyl diphosphate synthase type II